MNTSLEPESFDKNCYKKKHKFLNRFIRRNEFFSLIIVFKVKHLLLFFSFPQKCQRSESKKNLSSVIFELQEKGCNTDQLKHRNHNKDIVIIIKPKHRNHNKNTQKSNSNDQITLRIIKTH